jgi:hypothetical protein
VGLRLCLVVGGRRQRVESQVPLNPACTNTGRPSGHPHVSRQDEIGFGDASLSLRSRSGRRFDRGLHRRLGGLRHAGPCHSGDCSD